LLDAGAENVPARILLLLLAPISFLAQTEPARPPIRLI